MDIEKIQRKITPVVQKHVEKKFDLFIENESRKNFDNLEHSQRKRKLTEIIRHRGSSNYPWKITYVRGVLWPVITEWQHKPGAQFTVFLRAQTHAHLPSGLALPEHHAINCFKTPLTKKSCLSTFPLVCAKNSSIASRRLSYYWTRCQGRARRARSSRVGGGKATSAQGQRPSKLTASAARDP